VIYDFLTFFQSLFMDEYIGIVKLFGGNFAPKGWFLCNGQLLNIAQYQALFAIIGTTYGGNGTTTFALPDLQGRVPVGVGQGAGLPPVVQGQIAGSANLTLTTANIPPHTHSLMVSSANGTGSNPSSSVPAVSNFDDPSTGNNVVVNSYAAQPTGTAAPQAITPTGNGVPVNIMPPYLGLNYIICWQGIFPPRD
jgi:microcystin-dependent protein